MLAFSDPLLCAFQIHFYHNLLYKANWVLFKKQAALHSNWTVGSTQTEENHDGAWSLIPDPSSVQPRTPPRYVINFTKTQSKQLRAAV